MSKPLNRCECCNKFKSWDQLTSYEFIPDSEFTKESQTYVCDDCKKDFAKGITVIKFCQIP